MPHSVRIYCFGFFFLSIHTDTKSKSASESERTLSFLLHVQLTLHLYSCFFSLLLFVFVLNKQQFSIGYHLQKGVEHGYLPTTPDHHIHILPGSSVSICSIEYNILPPSSHFYFVTNMWTLLKEWDLLASLCVCVYGAHAVRFMAPLVFFSLSLSLPLSPSLSLSFSYSYPTPSR